MPTDEPPAILVVPDMGVGPVMSLLNAATRTIRMHIHLLTYKEIIEALQSARGRGVDVRVIVENQPLDVNVSNRPTLNVLQAAGVGVRSGYSAFKLAYAKYLIVDERVALVMTFDATRAAVTTGRGFGVRLTEPTQIAELLAVFEADWRRAASSPTHPHLVWSAVNARARLATMLDTAAHSLDIECADLQDEELARRVIRALQRGVNVRFVTSPMPDSGEAPAWLNPFVQAGAQVRLVKTPAIQATLIVADQMRVFVGSTRLTTIALDTYRDLGVVLDDTASVGALTTTFAYDWNIGK